MSESPEWAAMSPESRRLANWQAEHEIGRLGSVLRDFAGSRWAGASLDAVGDSFRYRVRVAALTDDEGEQARRRLGEHAAHVDLLPVARSYEDLSAVQDGVREFVAAGPDAAAHSASSIDVRRNAVKVWIRPDASALWDALSARFGSAVVVEWGESHFGWSAPRGEGPPSVAG